MLVSATSHALGPVIDLMSVNVSRACWILRAKVGSTEMVRQKTTQKMVPTLALYAALLRASRRAHSPLGEYGHLARGTAAIADGPGQPACDYRGRRVSC